MVYASREIRNRLKLSSCEATGWSGKRNENIGIVFAFFLSVIFHFRFYQNSLILFNVKC